MKTIFKLVHFFNREIQTQFQLVELDVFADIHNKFEEQITVGLQYWIRWILSDGQELCVVWR